MRKERALQVILWLVLTAVAAYTLFPLLFLLINAFKSQSEIIADPMKMPANWDFNYIFEAVKKLDFANAFATTFVITFCSVLLIVVLAALSAWMMVRSNTRLSRIQFLMFTAAMLVPFQAIMYPLMSEFEILGLRNVAGLILMYGGFGMPMSIFLYHGFIKNDSGLTGGGRSFRWCKYFSGVFPSCTAAIKKYDSNLRDYQCNVDME